MAGIGQCAICFSHLVASQAYAVTKCGHTFHEKCIRQWIKTGKNCPSCRVKASDRDVLKLFIQEHNLDDTFATQDPNSAVKIAEIESKLDDIKQKLSKVTDENVKLITEKRSLNKQLDKLRKDNDRVVMLQAQLYSMEDQLKDLEATRFELESTKAKLHASLFYKLLTAKDQGEDEFQKYLKPNGEINETKFLKMMTAKHNELKVRLDASNKTLKETEKALTAEKQKRLRDQAVITSLREEVKKLREAHENDEEPPTPNPALKEVLDYSPVVKKCRPSMGFLTSTPVFPKEVVESAYKQKSKQTLLDDSKRRKPLKAFSFDSDEDDADYKSTPCLPLASIDISPIRPRFSRVASCGTSKFGTTVNDKLVAKPRSIVKKKGTNGFAESFFRVEKKPNADVSIICLDD